MDKPQSIVLCVCGSVAAYKAALLARLCVERGAKVFPVLTKAATQFVTPLTFTALTSNKTIVDLWEASSAGEISHVEYAHQADVVVIAPATADTLARLAHGRADDPVAAIALSTRAPLIIAPAMETGMWEHPATQANAEALRARGAIFVGPQVGALASGRSGQGRMAEPETIAEVMFNLEQTRQVAHDLSGERILVTAGPTREALDPVRFWSNRSTGKMGYAVAAAAQRRGAKVHLISGPTSLSPPPGVEFTAIETTCELHAACEKHVAWASMVVMAAAPCDFRPEHKSPHKLKKLSQTALTVTLVQNPDVLASLRKQNPSATLVGFAAESQNLEENAWRKLHNKGLDLIVANDITQEGAGFGVDTNEVLLLRRDGKRMALAQMPKSEVAGHILTQAQTLRDELGAHPGEAMSAVAAKGDPVE